MSRHVPHPVVGMVAPTLPPPLRIQRGTDVARGDVARPQAHLTRLLTSFSSGSRPHPRGALIMPAA
eukprot:5974522-Pyramimonas_sp.AAC.1